jgi:hypothetical protein
MRKDQGSARRRSKEWAHKRPRRRVGLALRRDDAGESPLKTLNRKVRQKSGRSGRGSISKTHNLCSQPESACRYRTPAPCPLDPAAELSLSFADWQAGRPLHGSL